MELTGVPTSGEVRASTVVERVPGVVLCDVPFGIAHVRLAAGLEVQALFSAIESLVPGETVDVRRSSVRRGGVETWTFVANRCPSAGETR